MPIKFLQWIKTMQRSQRRIIDALKCRRFDTIKGIKPFVRVCLCGHADRSFVLERKRRYLFSLRTYAPLASVLPRSSLGRSLACE